MSGPAAVVALGSTPSRRPEGIRRRGQIPAYLADAPSDVATTLWHWAPLADPRDRDPALSEVDVASRVALFCRKYGLDPAERRLLLDVADRRITSSWEAMRMRAATRGGGWARMWEQGAGERIDRAHRWLERHRPALAAALE